MKNVFAHILLILFAALVIYIVWFFVTSERDVQANLVGVIVILAVAVATHYFAQKRDIKSRHFEQKAAVYTQVMDMFIKFAKQEKEVEGVEKEEISQAEMFHSMMKIKSELMIWADAQVVNAWLEFEAVGEGDKIVSWIKLIQAIRADLGHNDLELDESGVLKLIVIPKELDSLTKNNSNQS